MKVLLVSLYELGRPPLTLAHLASALKALGATPVMMDLSLERLDPAMLADVDAIAVSLPMYTATRLAEALVPRLRSTRASVPLVAFGLYAPLNEAWLRSLGIDAVFSGRSDDELARYLCGLPAETRLDAGRPLFRVPSREGLPGLGRYAKLRVAGEERLAALVETTRGCKHLCRHCPVVPVYEGHFDVVPLEIVLEDIRGQVAGGAQHLSFADPDFFNGPAHGLRVVQAMHREFPEITFDAVIKIEHLLKERARLPVLRECGGLFITTAVESVDDDILRRLDKGHTRADFEAAVVAVRSAGLALLPTFVPFTPWTTREGYCELLSVLDRLDLVSSVSPVQLAIRLLVPAGSWLLRDPDTARAFGAFDPSALGHPWAHPDARVDALQREVQAIAADTGAPRDAAFGRIWEAAHRALGRAAPTRVATLSDPPPQLSEPWYCCAEPTTVERLAL